MKFKSHVKVGKTAVAVWFDLRNWKRIKSTIRHSFLLIFHGIAKHLERRCLSNIYDGCRCTKTVFTHRFNVTSMGLSWIPTSRNQTLAGWYSHRFISESQIRDKAVHMADRQTPGTQRDANNCQTGMSTAIWRVSTSAAHKLAEPVHLNHRG